MTESRRERRKRSLAQNAYLWGVVYPYIIDCLPAAAVNSTTIVPDYWHDYFCEKHFGSVEIGFPGSGKTRPRRSTTRNERGKTEVLSTTDFQDFVLSIQAECAEYGIYVPDPNEQERAA